MGGTHWGDALWGERAVGGHAVLYFCVGHMPSENGRVIWAQWLQPGPREASGYSVYPSPGGLRCAPQ